MVESFERKVRGRPVGAALSGMAERFVEETGQGRPIPSSGSHGRSGCCTFHNVRKKRQKCMQISRGLVYKSRANWNQLPTNGPIRRVYFTHIWTFPVCRKRGCAVVRFCSGKCSGAGIGVQKFYYESCGLRCEGSGWDDPRPDPLCAPASRPDPGPVGSSVRDAIETSPRGPEMSCGHRAD